jgi:D-glycero-D-manno-heptose 1,7-bisphosphate phosphatase
MTSLSASTTIGDNCDCRKPRPSLFHMAAAKYNVDIEKSYFIGDRWRDVEAGHAAGCTTILIECGYAEKRAEVTLQVIASSLTQAVSWIKRAVEAPPVV